MSGVFVYGIPIEECPEDKLEMALRVFEGWRVPPATNIAIITSELARRRK